MTGIIIQARKGSKRLPNKMVLPFFKEKGIFELLLIKLKSKYPNLKIVLATTQLSQDDELVLIAKKYDVLVYRGSENNVLSRFICAAKKYDLINIIRVCSDNPFLDVNHIKDLIFNIESDSSIDYVSYKTGNNIPVIKSHLGLFSEAVKLSTLIKITSFTENLVYLEHVTNYIYEHNELFNQIWLSLPKYMNNTESIRLTLDTNNDFNYEKELYEKVRNFSTKEIIENILKNDKLLKTMNSEIQNHNK